MKKILIAVAASVIFVATGCQTQETKPAAAQVEKSAEQMAYEKFHAEAKAAIAKAAKVDGVWRDTGKILKSAEKAAKGGDFKKAQKLAAKAADQGHLGYEQAMGQKNVGNPSYLN